MSTLTSAERQWFAVWSPAVAAAGAGSIATVAGAILYARFFRRIPTAEAIRPSMIARKAWIKGIVTRHVPIASATPTIFDFIIPLAYSGSFPWDFDAFRHQLDVELQNQTIHIRLAGVDAPEAAHFGRPSQPYSAESLAWLKAQIEGKCVYCQLSRRDRYGRIVANVHFVPRFLPASLFTGKSVSLEMIRAGWGTTYVQSGAEYGSVGKDEYLRVEEQAMATRIGMWERGTKGETPAQYKKRFAKDSSGAEPKVQISVSHAKLPQKRTRPTTPSLISLLLSWRRPTRRQRSQ